MHTLACNSMKKLISMECMEVWALCTEKHPYENWRTRKLIHPDVRRQYERPSAHTCMLFHSVNCLWNVWKYGHCVLWSIYMKTGDWFFLMSMRRLVHTLACYSMMTLISMECMEVWALCIVKHLYENWRTLWHDSRSWFFQMSGESMRGLVHTLACYSMMTLISMECMEVWALCIVKHLYENWRTRWHEPRSWFFQMSGESMRGLVHTLACYLWWHLYPWNVWKYGHYALWSIYSQPSLQRWCLLPKNVTLNWIAVVMKASSELFYILCVFNWCYKEFCFYKRCHYKEGPLYMKTKELSDINLGADSI